MEHLKNKRCRESLIDTDIASDHLGLLISSIPSGAVVHCLGWAPGQRGATAAFIEPSSGVQLPSFATMMHWEDSGCLGQVRV